MRHACHRQLIDGNCGESHWRTSRQWHPYAVMHKETVTSQSVGMCLTKTLWHCSQSSATPAVLAMMFGYGALRLSTANSETPNGG